MISNGLIFISGQLPMIDNKIIYRGKIELDLSIEDTKKAVLLSACNLLNVLCKSIEENELNESNIKVLNIKGYLNTEPSFKNHSILFNEASNIFIDVLGGNYGAHSRSVIGVNSLPLDSPVEIDGIFSILNHDEK